MPDPGYAVVREYAGRCAIPTGVVCREHSAGKDELLKAKRAVGRAQSSQAVERREPSRRADKGDEDARIRTGLTDQADDRRGSRAWGYA